LSDKILHRLRVACDFLEVDPRFLAQDQIEQRFQNTSPTLAFACGSSGIAYEQPARYQRLDAPGELVRENVNRGESD
jgi:hypothetical protein